MISVVYHVGVMDVFSEVDTLAEGASSYLESSYFLVSYLLFLFKHHLTLNPGCWDLDLKHSPTPHQITFLFKD